VQEAKGNPHCRRLSLRPKKTLVLRRGITLSFSTSAGGIRGEDPEQNSPEKSSINQLPAKTFFSEILQSPLKCFLLLGKPRKRACFKGSESSTVSPCRSPGSSSNSRSRLDLCGTTTCAPVRKKAPVVVFLLCGRKKGHHRTELPLWSFLFGPSSLLVFSGVWQKRKPYFTRYLQAFLIHLHHLKPLPTTTALEQERPRSLSTEIVPKAFIPFSAAPQIAPNGIPKPVQITSEMMEWGGSTTHSSELHRNYPCEMLSFTRILERATVSFFPALLVPQTLITFFSQLCVCVSVGKPPPPPPPPPPPKKKKKKKKKQKN